MTTIATLTNRITAFANHGFMWTYADEPYDADAGEGENARRIERSL